QDLPSTSQVQPTTPPLPIAQPPSPQQQPQPSHDAEISMDLLHTLLETCTTLTRRVKHLDQDKIAQSLEITKVKQRVKKLERRNKLKVSKLRRLKRVGTSQRVDTSDDTIMDDVSKQRGIIANIDADEDVAVVAKDVDDVEKTAEIEENTKPSTKLTFYKAFFSPQWKFLIHTILQCMSAKRTSWNEFSSSMASVVIYLSTGKGFSGVDTPLFKGMIVAQQDDDVADEGAVSVAVDDVPAVVD
nr:hypothetical protein [Tanacetum cinerariifolium]